MKSIFLILVIFFTNTYLFSQDKPDIDKVNNNKNKVIKIAFGFDKHPFVFGQNMLKGIEPDILKEAFALVGYEIEGIRMTKNHLETILTGTNDIDGVSTISPNDKSLFYSDDFTVYENYVITRKSEHLNINSIQSLKYIKFVAWKDAYNDLGNKFYKLFNPINGTNKTSYHDTLFQSEDVKLFFSKKVNALIIDKTIFSWYKNLYKNKDEFIFHKIFPNKKIYPVTFKDKKIRDIFNIGLKKLKSNGRYQQIINFYQNQNINQLNNYVNILSEISAKYIYTNRDKKLTHIIDKFFIHPNIKSVRISTLYKNIINLNKKYSDINTLPYFEKNIYFNNKNDILHLGKLKVIYSKNYKSSNGLLIPPIERFKDLSKEDFEFIKSLYIKYNIINLNNLNLTKKEKNYINNHKTITVHNESLWAPYNFNENGIPKGFSIDYIDLLAKKLGIEIKYINNYSWNDYLELIKLEKIDVISNIVKTNKRSKYINFTKPFITSRKAIFSNIEGLNNLSDLANKTVAIPKGFFIEEYIHNKYPKIKIKTYKNTLESIIAVVNKEADALIENYSVVNYLIKRNGLKIKYMSIRDDKELMSQISLGIRKSQPILRDILQKAQNNVTAQELEILKNKWFGLNNKSTNIFTKKQENYLKKKKELRICTNPNWRPIEFIDNGIPKGISIDIINLITKKLNLDTKYIKTNSWIQSQEYFKNNKCDILVSAIKTKQRDKYANFTRPYLSYNLAIVTQNNKPLVNNIKNIIENKMSRKKGSGLIQTLEEKYPNINILKTNSYKESFEMVQDGDVYFTMATLPILSYYRKKYNFDNLQIAGYSKLKLDLRIAVNKNDKELLVILDEMLRLLPQDNIDIINKKWTSQEVIKVVDYTIVWTIVLISIIIISLIVIAYISQYKLKQNIKKLNNSLEEKVKYEIQKNSEKEKMMLHQSRLAQMGEVISMIAHQWRQPLNSLSMLNQSILLKYSINKLDDQFLEYFKINSKQQIDLMSNTIDDFRDFFKPEKEKSNFCINEIIKNTIDIVNPVLLKDKIEIKSNLQKDIFMNGYPNEFGQAVLNIINNAKDALIENNIKDKKIEIKLLMENNNIILAISDNAKGIPKNIIDNIFDPYFSTKNEKNGTGLGLYMTKIILENHMDGKIMVENKNDGAIFSIKFEYTKED